MRSEMRTSLATAFTLAAALLAGCADEEEPEAEMACPKGFYEDADATSLEDCVVDTIAVGELVRHIAEGGTYLQPVNAEPFVQQHGPDKLRIVYASTQTLLKVNGTTVLTPRDAYRTIDPEDLDATFDYELPVGTMFVHYTPEGPPYGAMVKQAEGTEPDDNDWFFGRYDEYGYPQPIEGYDGQTCRDCHVLDDRPARTDMLWGVPRSAL